MSTAQMQAADDLWEDEWETVTAADVAAVEGLGHGWHAVDEMDVLSMSGDESVATRDNNGNRGFLRGARGRSIARAQRHSQMTYSRTRKNELKQDRRKQGVVSRRGNKRKKHAHQRICARAI